MNTTKIGARNNSHDTARIQAIHDRTMELGAVCPDPSSGVTFPIKAFVPSDPASMLGDHDDRKGAFDFAAAQMGAAFAESPARHGQRLAQVTTALRGWAGEMFAFFHDGFESGRLQHSATFPPDYVCTEILDLAQNDLSIMDRVAYQNNFLSQAFTDTLGRAETLAQLAMQPAYDAGWIKPVWMLCFFDDDIAVRSTPYAPVGIVSVPYVATRYPFDTVVLPHEVAHFLWDYAEIETGGIDDTVPGALEGLPHFVQSWANETFCDAYASAVAGTAPALWFWQKMEAVANVRANRMGQFSYSADNGKHIPYSLRPLVFAKVLSVLGRPLAQELYERWVGTTQKRGLPPVNTVIDGRMVDVPANELIDFSLSINPAFPMDKLVATLVPLVARLKPNVLLRHSDGAKDLDELASHYVKDAAQGFGESLPNYDAISLRVKSWKTLCSELEEAHLPGVDAEKDALSEAQWMELFKAGGWTKQRQHNLKGETMNPNLVWHPQYGWVESPAAQKGPSVNWNPAAQMDPSVNWNAAAQMGPSVNWNPATQMGPSVNWNAAPQMGPSVNWNAAPQMGPSVNWNAATQMGPSVNWNPATQMGPSVNWNRSADYLPDSRAIKMLGNNRLGGYLMLWGNESTPDLQGEFFTPRTEQIKSIFNGVGALPFIYNHAQDGTMKSTVIGRVDVLQPDDYGMWYEVQLKSSDEYHEYIEGIRQLTRLKKLGTSSGALPGSVKVAPTGEILAWAAVEVSATTRPADHRQMERPIAEIKSAFQAIGFDFASNGRGTPGANGQFAATGTGNGATERRTSDAQRIALELELMRIA